MRRTTRCGSWSLIVVIATGCSFPGSGSADGPIGGDDAPPSDAAADAPIDASPDAQPPCGGVVCDDGDPCTTDRCDGVTCQYAPVDLPTACVGGARFSCATETTCYVRCPIPTTWALGEASCVQWGGHLVTLANDAESACAGAALGNNVRAWIGYFQPPGTQEPDSGWIWSSGATTSDTTWENSQPNQSGEQDCAFAQGLGGTWYDHECDAVEHGYLCER